MVRGRRLIHRKFLQIVVIVLTWGLVWMRGVSVLIVRYRVRRLPGTSYLAGRRIVIFAFVGEPVGVGIPIFCRNSVFRIMFDGVQRFTEHGRRVPIVRQRVAFRVRP